MYSRVVAAICAIGLVAGCQTTDGGVSSAEPDLRSMMADPPPGAPPGSCWAKDISPAVVETVTQQVLLQPAEVAVDGSVLSPAIYKTETRQAIVQQRKEVLFEIPCARLQTIEFVSTLQRALQARGLYRGAISGQIDARTRAAIRRYQKPEGLDSSILSLASARKLGIVALDRKEVTGE